MGDLPGGGTHHSRTAATQPLVGLEFLPQQGQEPGQVTGVVRSGEDQGQIRRATAGQLAGHLIHCPLQGHIPREGGATPGTGIPPGKPGKGRKRSHGRTLSPEGCTDNGA